MRIISEPEQAPEAPPQIKMPPRVKVPFRMKAPPHVKRERKEEKKKIRLSWEDIILAVAVLVIVASWIQGAFTPEQVLGYLGFTATGGIWGYVSGSSSKN